MDSVVDDRRPVRNVTVKPALRMSKTYLGCRMVRQLDGTVKVWAPVWGQSPPRWDLVKVASSMKSAHNFVHNTRAKKG
jgi:hypothetical protein